MPVWLQIVLGIIGAIGTLGGVLGFSAYLSARAKHRAELLNAQEDRDNAELEEMKQKRYEDRLRSIIQEEIKPIKLELEGIKEQLTDNTRATVTELRCDMKDHRDRYIDKGFATSSEKAAFNDLYNDYKGLGGNHFKNYVDQWKEDVELLPSEKKTRKQTKRKQPKKQLLVENK